MAEEQGSYIPTGKFLTEGKKFLKANLTMQILAMFVVLIIAMMLLPFPGWLLDVMMVGNVAISFVILLVVLYTRHSSDFSSFPRVVLFVALYGIGLNICSTKFILTNGSKGFDKFGGGMIKVFSSLVAGDADYSLVIGLIIFLILIVVQMVITKGSTRVAEVAARFALDSMPQKLFAVDSDLQAGVINEEEAREKREKIRGESDFYSAMDGSSKFVSGNVKAGIFITIVNLVGGIIIASAYFGMSLTSVNGKPGALDCFARFTIGDGLLSQLPSLILSFATGVLVTGTNSKDSIGDQLKDQFRVNGNVFFISGIVLVLIGFAFYFIGNDSSPILLLIFLAIGGLLAFYGWGMINGRFNDAQAIKTIEKVQKKQAETAPQASTDVSPVVPLDQISLELGYGLLALANPEENKDGEEMGREIVNRIKKMRVQLGLDLGLVIPSVRVLDNMLLDSEEYSFKIKGIEKGRFKIKPGYYMCINTGGVSQEMQGEATYDPAFGMPALWISKDLRQEAESNGYAVIDAPTIIITHITEILRTNASEVLGRKEVAAILDRLKEDNPVVVNEVLETYKFTYGEIQKILQGLLQEQVSIRDIVTILETISNYGAMQYHDTWFLIEKVRQALGIQICKQYVNQDNELAVIQLSQFDSEYIMQHCVDNKDGSRPYVAFDPVDGRKWISGVSGVEASLKEQQIVPIILCPADVRQLVKVSVERELPGTIVLSIDEVVQAGNAINLKIVGEISVFRQ